MKSLVMGLKYIEACPKCGDYGQLYMGYLIHGEKVYGPYYRVQHSYSMYDPGKYQVWKAKGIHWIPRRSAKLTQHVPRETWCHIGKLHD